MKESQYIEYYLVDNTKLGRGKGYTVQTYIAYALSGAAKSYSKNYVRALKRALDRRVAQGTAVLDKSARGGVAGYLPEAK